MPRKAGALAGLGCVEEQGSFFRADVQYRGPGGQKMHIYGPQRGEASLANQDLIALRAVGALFEGDREKGLVAMRAEARRIQERVTYEREIRLAMLCQDPSDFDSDAEKAEEDGVDYDPDEWRRDLQDGKHPRKTLTLRRSLRLRSALLQMAKRLRNASVLYRASLGWDRRQQGYTTFQSLVPEGLKTKSSAPKHLNAQKWWTQARKV